MHFVDSTKNDPQVKHHYRPILRENTWYVVKVAFIPHDLAKHRVPYPFPKEIPLSGNGPGFTRWERDEAVAYANSINEANGYPLYD